MFTKFAALSTFVAFVVAQAPPLSSAYLTSGADSSFCLAAAQGFNDSSNSRAVVATCAETSVQNWQFPSVNDGASVQIQTPDQSGCLFVSNGNDIAEVHIEACDSTNANQFWTYTSDDTFEWTGNDKCLTASVLKDNYAATSSPCDSDSLQVWNAVTSILT